MVIDVGRMNKRKRRRRGGGRKAEGRGEGEIERKGPSLLSSFCIVLATGFPELTFLDFE